MFSNVWSENTALFERLMEIHSNSPKLYYGFKKKKKHLFMLSGLDPGFSFRGAKDYVPTRTLRVRNRTYFRQGSRARLRALEALGLFYCSLMLSEPYFQAF